MLSDGREGEADGDGADAFEVAGAASLLLARLSSQARRGSTRKTAATVERSIARPV
jgi:hypothetical protein